MSYRRGMMGPPPRQVQKKAPRSWVDAVSVGVLLGLVLAGLLVGVRLLSG